MTVRIIPRLDIKGPNLVKGVHLEGLRVLGKPEDFARFYYKNGADELIYMDAVASLYGRNSLSSIIEKTAKEIFIPLCVGGGIRNLDDIRTVLRAGADKVAINTAVISNPGLIEKAAHTFGSSTIVVGIEAYKHSDGRYEAYYDYGRERSGIDAIEWATRAVELGAGELLVSSINQEGTGKGFDLELVSQISGIAPIPVIAHGGAGKKSDILDVLEIGMADAVSIASILHYDCLDQISKNEKSDYRLEGNIEFLQKGVSPKTIEPESIPGIKKFLMDNGIACRII